MQVKGTIKRVNAEQQVSDKFKKRTVHIETEGEYPQTIEVQFTQDKTSLLDGFSEGQSITIDINLRGREWTGNDGVLKVFNTIEGWRISSDGEAPQPSISEEINDDLPF
jgi:hypothetical protein